MIVYHFDDDRKFPLVSSLTTAWRNVRTEVVADGPRKNLRIVAQAESRLDPKRSIVLALPMLALGGAMERIELEMSGATGGLQVYIEGSGCDGGGLVWELSNQEGTPARRVLAALVAAPQDRWDQDGAHRQTAVAPPLTFHRLRLTAPDASTVDIVLHELRLTGDVGTAPAGTVHG